MARYPFKKSSLLRLFGVCAACAGALAALLLVMPRSASAGGVVSNCTDAGLSAALAGGGLVTFNCGPATISVTATKVITTDTIIDGGGVITISGDGVRVFSVTVGANATFANLRISYGLAPAGAALYNNGTTTATNAVFDSNYVNGSGAAGGGAIYSHGSLTVISSTLSNNIVARNGFAAEASGGAIFSDGALAVAGSTFSSNQAQGANGAVGKGGAIRSSGTLDIRSSTFSGNSTTAGGYAANGGAVYNDGSAVISATAFLTNSAADSGGSIYTTSTLTLTNSTLSGGSAAAGGGVFNGGTLLIGGSTLSGNSATYGGAVYGGSSGRLTLATSTLSGNSAQIGGALVNYGTLAASANTISGNSNAFYNYGTGTLTNSTIAGNTQYGVVNSGALTVTNSTVVSNTVRGILHGSGSTRLQNTLLAFNDQNCAANSGAFSSLGHNLENANTCGLSAGGDLTNTDPLIGPLQDNGGPNRTYALRSGSPAINGGDNAACPATDQRGVARPEGGTCDIGAYEALTADLYVTKSSGQPTVVPGSAITYTIVVTNGGPEAVSGAVLTDSVPASVGTVTWSCSATAGSACGAPSGSGNALNLSLDLLAGGSAQVSVMGTLSAALSSTLTNTARVLPPASPVDPNLKNNTADDVSAPVLVQFSAGTYRVTESGGAAVITLTLSVASPQTVTVNLATSNGTATAGVDYAAVNRTLSFAPGVTVLTTSVPITNDLIVEPDQTVNLALSLATNAAILAPGSAMLVIVDGHTLSMIVNSTADDGDANVGDALCLSAGGACTLRAAIQESNQRAVASTIQFSLTLPATITLGSPLPAITRSLSIAGPGAAALTIAGNCSGSVLNFNSGGNAQVFALAGLTVQGGCAPNGGGVYVAAGDTLNASGVALYHNQAATYGGGLYNAGTLMLSGSSVYSNTALIGAGIENIDRATVTDSQLFRNSGMNSAGMENSHVAVLGSVSIYSNTATGWGGGLGTYDILTLTNSAIYSNTADRGGGFYQSGRSSVSNSTVSGNAASSFGGGMFISNNGSGIELTNDTVANNSAPAGMGGGLALGGGFTSLRNTLVANNSSENCAFGVTNSSNHNLDSGNSCGFAATGDLTNTNPLLGPLQDNGGPTLSSALPANSPAVNAGDNAVCPAADQRGVARPQAGACDIGAYEYTLPPRLYLPLLRR